MCPLSKHGFLQNSNVTLFNVVSPFESRCVKGVCVALDAQTYRCDCEEGYHGSLCNLQGEPEASCQSPQCLHGRCEVTDDGERCVCEQGYTGEGCDIGEDTGEEKVHTLFSPGEVQIHV